MNTELAFLCDSATDDRGKLHALGIGIDSVQGDSLPMTHPRFIIVCVVTVFRRRSRRKAHGNPAAGSGRSGHHHTD